MTQYLSQRKEKREKEKKRKREKETKRQRDKEKTQSPNVGHVDATITET